MSCGYFLFSSLGFVPVPWPDAACHYLPWLDLFQWSPRWKAHMVAAFIPSADEANLGLMPGLTVVLGGFSSLGLMSLMGPTLALKFISIGALAGWTWIFWTWLRGDRNGLWPWLGPVVLGGAALWAPTMRWTSLSVRPEAWLGLVWLLLLRNFWKLKYNSDKLTSRHLWSIAGLLSAGAYFHFSAVFLVPGVCCAMLPMEADWPESLRKWIKNLIGVGCRTLIFLAPWLVYCVQHYSIAQEQLGLQFSRLSFSNPWFKSGVFMALFNEMGSPAGLPPFFDAAKWLFWLMILIMMVAILGELVSMTKRGETSSSGAKAKRKLESHPIFPLELASSLTFWASVYLWYDKPEVWYVGLCHFYFWSWVGVMWLGNQERIMYFVNPQNLLQKFLGPTLVALAAIFGLISISATIAQFQAVNPSYAWSVYNEWVNCIDGAIQYDIHHKHPKIWQTYLPDVLVDLSFRHPDYDLTRTLDSPELADRAWRFAHTADAIILSTYFNEPINLASPNMFTRYIGPRRQGEEAIYQSVPFGDAVLHGMFPPQWNTTICHFGGFWASVLTRRI